MERSLARLRRSAPERVETLSAYLRYPSISSDPAHAADVARCADFTAHLLADAGLNEVTIHPTALHPVVTASWRGAPGRPTVLIYGHYDVQPVDPLDLWDRPPFEPHLRDQRIVARGAADDKGQVLMHIQAVRALLQETGALPVNVVFLIEGEEEIGSPHLPAFLQAHRELLRADLAIISDSSMWGEGQPAITVSLRGLTLLELTLTGPNRDLHSGSYGGAVANPLEMLARLLASLKDDQGRIRIPGFYDAVRELLPEERWRMEAAPLEEAEFLADLEVPGGWGEAGRPLAERLWRRPTCEINGMWGGYCGPGSKTVLPSQAHAKLSFRLVPDQDPDLIAEQVKGWLESQSFPGVILDVQRIPGGGRPILVPHDAPFLTAARAALAEAFGREPLLIGEGASIPVTADFKTVLGMDTLLLGFGLPDARTHSPNENFHLPTFHTGTESLVRLLHHLA
ncbi:MAG: dipeptidase [Magnetococcales bacterium]|nr:dipeptidase [Magnetococcales bacterium]